jgi:hypothetical protein
MSFDSGEMSIQSVSIHYPSSASDGLLTFPAGVIRKFKIAAVSHTGNIVFEWSVKYLIKNLYPRDHDSRYDHRICAQITS